MSCITQILKLKGDQEVLMAHDCEGNPWIAVEGGGTYKDYEYLIVFTDMGHRCGYVAIPSHHKFSKTEKAPHAYTPGKEVFHYNELDIKCHGNLTFMSEKHGLKNLLSIPCNDIWIGFDCGQSYDAKDLKLVEKYYGEDCQQLQFYKKYPQYHKPFDFQKVREYDYVEEECQKIIDQLIGKAA